jgi:peroxiredoxin
MHSMHILHWPIHGPQPSIRIDRNPPRTEGSPLADTFHSLATTALGPGDKAPDFLLSDEKGASIWSGEILNRGPYVLAFHHGARCPACVSWLLDLDAAGGRIADRGADLIAVAAESTEHLAATKVEHGIRMKLLSDADCILAGEYGLTPPSRAAFLVNHEGIVAAAFVGACATARSVGDAIDSLRPRQEISRDAAE